MKRGMGKDIIQETSTLRKDGKWESVSENKEARPVLWIVVPCYNEEQVLPITAPLFIRKLNQLSDDGKISANSRVLFVNDGSKDRTWEIIRELADENRECLGICQSRNRGHQNAVLAGLMEAKDLCDITISIDCDGQDDINAMDEMIRQYKDGCDVVYGVRAKRDTDTFFKRWSAESFYKLLNRMGGEVVYNHADYRLISSRVLQELARFHEVNIFLRGLIPLVGFKSTSVYYDRSERVAGESHYPFRKMLALAMDGITSLSIRPIRIITALGFFISLASVLAIIWVIIGHFMGNTTNGWSSTVCAIFFMGGVQLLSIGVIGEYVGKIYLETKQRPRYIISDRIGMAEEDERP